jgi:type IV pilus assembly protein PilM
MVGLDLSDRSLKIVELTEETVPRVRTVGWSALTPNLMRRGVIVDPEGLTGVVREALRKCSPPPVLGAPAVVSIPESQSFVRLLDLPLMGEGEMDEAVQWAIRQHIPFDLDRVYLDWQLLSSDGRRQEVLVGAAQREVVDPLLETLDTSGLRVVAIELEAQALVRSLLPRDSLDINGILIVDLGAVTTNIIFFDRGHLRFTTSIQKGGDDLTQQLIQELQLTPQAAAEKKALVGVNPADDPAVAATLRVAALDLVRQVKNVIEETMSPLGGIGKVRALMLVGGAANLPGLLAVFGEIFSNLPVQLGNPWTNVAVADERSAAPLSPSDASHFATAIGLALRRAAEPATTLYARN